MRRAMKMTPFLIKLQKEKEKIDLKKIEVLEVDGINHYDYPKYCDAFISEANYNGEPMSDEMLDKVNNDYPDFVHSKVWEFIN